MTNEIKQLFLSIKNDDLNSFNELTTKKKGLLSLCYGRFPILSLCYLFRSRRIVNVHEDRLCEVQRFTFTDEPKEAYALFKGKAKTSLRLYVFTGESEDKIVMPQEMLAIMGDSLYLEERYDRFKSTERTDSNIQRIYKRNSGKDVAFKDGGIAVSHPLTRLQRLILPIILVATLIMSILPLSLWTGLKSGFGFGTEKYPARIANLKQMETAFKSEGKMHVLTSDLTIPADWLKSDFRSNLDGNGHTIRFDGILKNGFIDTLSGTIKNVRLEFDYGEEYQSIEADYAFAVLNNIGKIENVSVEIRAKLIEQSDDDINVAGIVLNNEGSISSCTVDMNIDVRGGETGNASIGGIVAFNSGLIYDCTLSAESKITADTIDVAGIVVENSADGIVERSENKGTLEQETLSAEWMPSMGGIALNNYGTIKDCQNSGSIFASSHTSEASTGIYSAVFVGGIVCINEGSITKSKNDAPLGAYTKSYNAFVGGVSTLNYSTASEVYNSCSYGAITLNSDNIDAFLIAGGITGHSFGAISHSYSASEYYTESDAVPNNYNDIQGSFYDGSGRVYFGGIIGIGYYTASWSGMLFSTNEGNYYVDQENIEFSSALRQIQNSIYNYGLHDNAKIVESADELKSIDIYWG